MSKNERLRDEMAQEWAQMWFDGPMDRFEDEWQEVHATEEPPENLAHDYYEGMAEMVLRQTNCILDGIRARVAKQPGMSDVARRVNEMKVEIGTH